MKVTAWDHVRVAAWCYRQAADVHNNPVGMGKLSECFFGGRGLGV